MDDNLVTNQDIYLTCMVVCRILLHLLSLACTSPKTENCTKLQQEYNLLKLFAESCWVRFWKGNLASLSSPICWNFISKTKKKPALAACPCRPPHLKMFVAFCCSIRGTRWSTTCPKTIQRSKVRASTFSGDFWKQMSDVKDIFSPWDVGAYYMIGTDFTSYNWACWWHCLWDRPIQVVWNICWLYLHYVESSSGWKHVSFWIGASWNLSRIHFVAITSKMSTFFGVVASKLRYSSV